MSLDAKPNPTSASARPAPSGGLKATLRVAVPIVALMGVIFGVTLLSMYTQKPPSDDTPGKAGDAKQTGSEPPLRFFTSTRAWDPPSLKPEHAGYRDLPLLAPSGDPAKAELPFQFSLQDRVFQGFYEPGPQVRRAAFWFENRNPGSVTMQLKGVNCGACSGGQLAAIPPAVLKSYLQRTALGALPVGLFNAYGVGVADPAADFAKLEWINYKFSENPNATYKVPPAPAPGDKWAEQWGILELTFSVSPNPKVPLESAFATQVDGTEQTGGHSFQIFFAPSEACAVSRPTVEVGEINPQTPEREYQFLLYSAIRGPGSEFGDLDPPKYDVQAPAGVAPGEFVKVTKVERVPEAELLDVAQEFARQKKFTKVRAAYRVTLVVRREADGARLDLGQMERTVYLSAGNAKPQAVLVTARVKGAVWLGSGRTEIDLGTFKGSAGTEQSFELVTEVPGTELGVVEGECRPRYVKCELAKNPDRDGRGSYSLKISVPKGRQYGAVEGGMAVIEVKGAAPQRMRIPVRGSGGPG